MSTSASSYFGGAFAGGLGLGGDFSFGGMMLFSLAAAAAFSSSLS